MCDFKIVDKSKIPSGNPENCVTIIGLCRTAGVPSNLGQTGHLL